MAENDAVLVHCALCGGWVTLGACACVFPPPVAPPVHRSGLYGPDNPVAIEDPPLFKLVLAPKPGEIEALLATGVNVEERGGVLTDQWYTPLTMAAILGHVDVVKLLLEYNANVHAHGRTILHNVARIGFGHRSEVAKLLLDHGADVHATNSVQPFLGYTALHDAALSGHADVAKVLIHHGVHVLALTPLGSTAEVIATRNANPAVVAMIQTETLPRAKSVAFAMGFHERLGVASPVKALDEEVVRMVLELVLNP